MVEVLAFVLSSSSVDFFFAAFVDVVEGSLILQLPVINLAAARSLSCAAKSWSMLLQLSPLLVPLPTLPTQLFEMLLMLLSSWSSSWLPFVGCWYDAVDCDDIALVASALLFATSNESSTPNLSLFQLSGIILLSPRCCVDDERLVGMTDVDRLLHRDEETDLLVFEGGERGREFIIDCVVYDSFSFQVYDAKEVRFTVAFLMSV